MTVEQRQLNDKFLRALDHFTQMSKASLIDTARYALYEVCDMIIYRTPVDTGRLRSNWQASLNWRISDKVNTTVDPTFELKVSTESLKAGDTFFYYNNLDYAPVVEYGLYPNPPKKGSLVKSEGGTKEEWVIKSDGGYSKQAPQGMMRISINIWSDAVNKEWQKRLKENNL